MNKTAAPQQSVSLLQKANSTLKKLNNICKEGWSVISSMRNGPYYMGVMEKCLENVHYSNESMTIFLPPRKK